jgi:hypothetical protein
MAVLASSARADEPSYHPLGKWHPVTSDYGWRKNPLNGGRNRQFHKGLDIDCQSNDPVYAWRSGVVRFAGRNSSSGNYINIAHADSYTSTYHHLNKILVKQGEQITAGQLIGRAGKTGMTTGSHLHFSILRNGNHLDPMPYIKKARRIDTPLPLLPTKVSVDKALRIQSYPIDGEIYIDGMNRGRTPIDVKLTYGEHFVEIDTGGKFRRFVGRVWIDQHFGHLFVIDLTHVP